MCQPKRFVEEYCIPSSKRRTKPVKDDNLCEIEIKEVDLERNLVRIHYKGYSLTSGGHMALTVDTPRSFARKICN